MLVAVGKWSISDLRSPADRYSWFPTAGDAHRAPDCPAVEKPQRPRGSPPTVKFPGRLSCMAGLHKRETECGAPQLSENYQQRLTRRHKEGQHHSDLSQTTQSQLTTLTSSRSQQQSSFIMARYSTFFCFETDVSFLTQIHFDKGKFVHLNI